MNKRYSLSWILVLFCVIFAAAAANAQWVKDGVPVGSSNGTQYNPMIIQDGANGAMVLWADDRSGVGWDIYGNRVTGDGTVLGGSGVPLCSALGDQYPYGGVFDEAGYVITVWSDQRDLIQHIYAQRIDTMGNVYWPTDGMDVCTLAVDPYNASIVSDGQGGAIIAWNETRNGNNDIYAQRIDAGGNWVWGDSAICVCSYSGDQYAPNMTADGYGGAIVVWTDYRSGGDSDIYGQRIDGDGNLLWDTDGVVICDMGNYQYTRQVVSASGGGAFVLWVDYRNSYDDMFVQKIDLDGVPLWSNNGQMVCDDAGMGYYKYTPALVDDGSGGAIIAWGYNLDGDAYEIYAQRLNWDGTMAWGWNGKQIIPCYTYDTNEISVAADGSGGAIATAAVYWDDYAPSEIYAQRVDYDGNLLWGPRGAAVCTAAEYQYTPYLISDGLGGAIVAWDDQRPETEYYSDIYCQRIGASGLWGNPEPEIISCADVPVDQGGWVRLTTRASSHDVAGEESAIFGYNVWRMIGGGGPLAASVGMANVLAADRSRVVALLKDPATAKGVRVSAADAPLLGLPEGDWESVGFWFATRDTVYNIAVPTKDDSTEAGVTRSVSTRMAQGHGARMAHCLFPPIRMNSSPA